MKIENFAKAKELETKHVSVLQIARSKLTDGIKMAADSLAYEVASYVANGRDALVFKYTAKDFCERMDRHIPIYREVVARLTGECERSIAAEEASFKAELAKL